MSRRDLLTSAPGALVAIAAVGALGGCGLRWERDAGSLPIVPSARPYPGAAALRAELARCREARSAAQAWSGLDGPALSRVLVRVHDEQIAALTARLEAVSEPTRAPDPAPPAAGHATSEASSAASARADERATTGTTSPAPDDEPARQRLLVAESAGLTDFSDLAAATAADRSLLAGCLVTRGQAARLLGARALPTTRRPVPASAEQAVDLLATVRPVVYGLEVATARVVVAGGQRSQVARASLAAALRQRQSLEQQAGSRAPAPPPGYELEAPVATAADAQELARRLLTALADAHVHAVGGTSASTPGTRDAPGSPPALSPHVIASLLGWAREAEWWRGAWGSQPRALATG